MTTDATPREVGSHAGLGLAPERATCERSDFMLAATREAQAFAAHYADEVLELRAEVARLRDALGKANEQAERFERGWYLRGDALEVAVRQNEHDMLMTGEELRACREALKA